MQIQSTKD